MASVQLGTLIYPVRLTARRWILVPAIEVRILGGVRGRGSGSIPFIMVYGRTLPFMAY